jgi:hypothetical protein
MAYKKTYLEDVLTGGSPLKKCPDGEEGDDCRELEAAKKELIDPDKNSTSMNPNFAIGATVSKGKGTAVKNLKPIQKKCPKGRAGKDCRKEKLKDAGRKAAVAVGGATLIHLGMGGYKKGDGDWVKKEGSLKKPCLPGKKGKACRDAKKIMKDVPSNITPPSPHDAGKGLYDYQLEDDYIPLKKGCPLGTKGAECRAKKKSKSHAWSFKSKKGRHLRGNI